MPFCNNPDRDVLVALYNATSGDNWTNNTNWLTDAPLYKWHGVNTDGRWNVHELILDNNQLAGQLPPEIGEFHAVKAIDFANNRLTGAIPAELGNLNVTALFLAHNQLTGCIPNALHDVRINDFDELGLPFCSESPPAFDECAYEISSIPYRYSGVGVGGMWTRDCVSTNRPGSYARFFTLTLHHPFDVTITLTSEQDTYLYLMGGIGADGLVLEENYDYVSTNSRIQAPLHPGNYTIEATTHDAGATGSFSLEVDVDVLGPAPLPTAFTDRAALTALYHSANGEDWHTSDNWLTDAPLSEWHGVEIGDSGRITRLDLEANNLSGELPLEFGNLDQLEWVNISHNQLTGELSRSLTNLTMLEYFYFDNNAGICAPAYDAFQEWAQTLKDFRGDACAPPPSNPERDALINLYHATRGDHWRNNTNWLTGAPLGEWYGVTTDGDGRVVELNLEDNDLSGHIPSELSNLTDLTELWLGNNQLSGRIPPEIGKLTRLTYLGIYGNDLSGEIPPELANLTGLEDLNLDLNHLSGEIPPELGDLTGLESLGLWDNNLSGEIPAELGNMTNLRHLRLDRNELTGEIPAELGDLINLDGLRLNENQLTGHIPADLGDLTELRTLDLSLNQLTGGIPPELSNLTNLIEIDIHTNRLGGEIPRELGTLSNLERMNLADNNLTGEIPSELADIETLTRLYLWDNDLTAEAFLPRLSEMITLERLSLSGNQIDGADVLPQVAALSNLIFLGLRDSRLTTDELLPYLDSLNGLEYLILSDNLLTGDRLLPMLAKFDDLIHLDVSRNQLTGGIPPGFGNHTRLRGLLLSENLLTGEVPPELGNFRILTYLHLNNNLLTGTLPRNLIELGWMAEFYFNNNAGLCAPADAAFQEWLQSISNVEGDNCETTPPPAPSECSEHISDFATYNRTLTSECTSENRTAFGDHYARQFTFTLSQPTTVEVVIRSQHIDTHIFVADDEGETIVDIDDYIGRNAGFRKALQPGTYSVEVTTFRSAQTGDFTITFGRPEFEALKALYESTGGTGWTRKNNWLSDAPLSEWQGVQTDSEGRVTQVNLIANNLTGEIPTELQDLIHLEGLYLGRNKLSGTVPGELGSLPALQVLLLSDNELTGRIPAQLGNLANLRELYLSRNQLGGSIPATLGRLDNLHRLHMAANELSGSIPRDLGNLSNLRQLSISDNSLTGSVPPHLANLDNLTHLYLWGNELTSGSFFLHLGDMDSLQFLDIGGNRIAGAQMLPELEELDNLTGLGLHDSDLSDDDLLDYMDDFQALDLEFLNLRSNGLSDPQILVGLSHITTLQRLAINDNDFSGQLPRSMIALTLMRIFHFDDNRGLCAPADAEFQNWLTGIRDFRGDTCGTVSPMGAPAQASHDAKAFGSGHHSSDDAISEAHSLSLLESIQPDD